MNKIALIKVLKKALFSWYLLFLSLFLIFLIIAATKWLGRKRK